MSIGADDACCHRAVLVVVIKPEEQRRQKVTESQGNRKCMTDHLFFLQASFLMFGREARGRGLAMMRMSKERQLLVQNLKSKERGSTRTQKMKMSKQKSVLGSNFSPLKYSS